MEKKIAKVNVPVEHWKIKILSLKLKKTGTKRKKGKKWKG